MFSGGLQKLAEKHNREYEEFEKIFLRYDDSVCRGEISAQELWQKYKDELGISNEEDFDFAKYWTQCFTLIQETFDLIEDLKKTGIPLGLLSNIYPGVFDAIKDIGLFPYMNWHSKILSSTEGTVKPELEIYEISENKAGVKPKNILFIDDKTSFLNPAKQRGWQTFHFDHNNPAKSIEKLRKMLKSKKVLT